MTPRQRHEAQFTRRKGARRASTYAIAVLHLTSPYHPSQNMEGRPLLDPTSLPLDGSFQEWSRWKRVRLPVIAKRVNDPDMVVPGAVWSEQVTAVLAHELPNGVLEPLEHLRSVLNDLHEYYAYPLRNETALEGSKPDTYGPVYSAVFPDKGRLFLVTNKEGRVLDRNDEPTNWIRGPDPNDQDFVPLRPRPRVDFTAYL